MTRIDRRIFMGGVASLTATACLAATSGFAANWRTSAPRRRKFTMDLVCGAIGVGADQQEAIRLAAQGGFESVQPSPGELKGLSESQLTELQQTLRDSHLVWGAAGLPVEFRRDDAAFRDDMGKLPALAKALQRAGGTRMSTWLSPAHGELTYMANFKQHVRRLREVAQVLADHGQRFGLEYVGPKTLWSSGRHTFIHTMAEARELIAEIGLPNVGLVLDSWHWYTAGETGADLLALTNQDVVACDLNDAPAGIEVEEQIDSRRELPTATGVIDVKTFLQALVEIGYDGPIRAEPFNKPLREMPQDEAIAATAAAMRKAFALVDEA